MDRGITSVADVELIEKEPLNLPDFGTYGVLKAGAALRPDATALQFFLQAKDFKKSEDFTYRELMGEICRAARMFRAHGVEREGVVSMIMPNLPETFLTLWGGEAAGIINPINPLLEAEQIAEILNAAGCRVLVTLGPAPKTDIWQKVSSILHKIPTLKTVLRVDIADHLGGIAKFALKTIGMFRSDSGIPAGIKVLDFNKELKKYSPEEPDFVQEIRPESTASYFHTGGTTGTPKLAGHTHKNEVYDSLSVAKVLGPAEHRVIYCGLPLFHVNGVFVTGLLPFSQGYTVILGTPAGFRGEGVFPNFWKITEHFKVNIFSGVPTVYRVLSDQTIGDSDVSSLEFAVCGAAPMPVNLFKEFEEKTGLRILEGYGLTEGTCVSSVNPPVGERRIGSIGFRIPYQEMKTVVLDENNAFERFCETDEIGMVCLRGANVFAGYKEEIHNKKAFFDGPDGGDPWVITGDLGRQDAEGYFWLTGRKKEIIIRGGHNIDPKTVEDPMSKHPAVAMTAAVGRPDPHAGEVVALYVQLKDNQSVTEKELADFAAEHIGEKAAVPKVVRILDEIPLTAVGKIFKPKLLWAQIKEVYEAELSDLPGVVLVNAHVGQDKVTGVSVRIRLETTEETDQKELSEKIRERLGNYSYPYELLF